MAKPGDGFKWFGRDGAINPDDLAAYNEYAERAIADRDNRTPILAFNEWLSAGRPRGPFTNG
jgi:hypothetical protein